MSIKQIRDALHAAGIPGAKAATMRYGEHEVQIFSVDGREIERPAGEMASVSVAELVKALKDTENQEA